MVRTNMDTIRGVFPHRKQLPLVFVWLHSLPQGQRFGIAALNEFFKVDNDHLVICYLMLSHVTFFNCSLCDLLWSTCDLLFSRDVALTYWSAIHFSHLHITLNLPKVQSQVLTMDSHKCAAFPGASQRGDLLEMMIMNIISFSFFYSTQLFSWQRKNRKWWKANSPRSCAW